MTQYSLFGAEAAAPALDDLDGLLLAGAQWVQAPPGARLSVVVPDRWRADALEAELGERGIGDAEPVVRTATGYAVRTAFVDVLRPRAARWSRGSRQAPPAGLTLTAAGLRLWALAAGRRDEGGFLLRVGGHEDLQRAAGSALAGLGVAAVALGTRGGPGWRVTSAKRLRRLVELVGPPPAGASGVWPSPPGTGSPPPSG